MNGPAGLDVIDMGWFDDSVCLAPYSGSLASLIKITSGSNNSHRGDQLVHMGLGIAAGGNSERYA